ncbi:hypothetical protein [Calidifontibacillus erzurumensis]|uniref:Uncharacterized protein n=1 Tax=Calidifontibacillus erzurumensis TaxID=2741433 RepID=A0A8J8GIZ1_9BACI|nr:hypothetical protein [Calidifontibacillus erzurumensis]NSL53223.1 hypothetical protein [Calidifontibacillus erzurumensis]
MINLLVIVSESIFLVMFFLFWSLFITTPVWLTIVFYIRKKYLLKRRLRFAVIPGGRN